MCQKTGMILNWFVNRHRGYAALALVLSVACPDFAVALRTESIREVPQGTARLENNLVFDGPASQTGLAGFEEPVRVWLAYQHPVTLVGEKAWWLGWAEWGWQRQMPSPDRYIGFFFMHGLVVPSDYLTEHEKKLAKGEWPKGRMRKELMSYLYDRETRPQRPADSALSLYDQIPLFIVRSSSDRPYPGLLDSIWIGVNKDWLERAAPLIGRERAETLRAEFLYQWGTAVCGIPRADFERAAIGKATQVPRRLVEIYQKVIRKAGYKVPNKIEDQLAQALAACRRSAGRLRESSITTEVPPTAAILQPFLPTLDPASGIGGMRFLPSETGGSLEGEVVLAALGDSLMKKGSRQPPLSLDQARVRFPKFAANFEFLLEQLRKQGMPFWIEFAFSELSGELFVLQVTPQPVHGEDCAQLMGQVMDRSGGQEGYLVRNASLLSRVLPASQKRVVPLWKDGIPSPQLASFAAARSLQPGLGAGTLRLARQPVSEGGMSVLYVGSIYAVPSERDDQLLTWLASGRGAGLVLARDLSLHERQHVELQAIPAVRVDSSAYAQIDPYWDQQVVLDAGAGSLHTWVPERLATRGVDEPFTLDGEAIRQETERRCGKFSYTELDREHTLLLSQAIQQEADLRRDSRWERRQTLSGDLDWQQRIRRVIELSLQAHVLHQMLIALRAPNPEKPWRVQEGQQGGLRSLRIFEAYYRSGSQRLETKDEGAAAEKRQELADFFTFLREQGQAWLADRAVRVDYSRPESRPAPESTFRFEHEDTWDPDLMTADVRIGFDVPQDLLEVTEGWLRIFYAQRSGTAAGKEEEELDLASVVSRADVQQLISRDGFAAVKGGFLVRPAAFGLSGKLFLDTGLREPSGLPPGMKVVRVDSRTAAEMAKFVMGQGVENGDGMLFNGRLWSPAEVAVCLSGISADLAAALLDPRVEVTARELAAILEIARRMGTIYVARIVQLTFGETGEPLLYIQAQA